MHVREANMTEVPTLASIGAETFTPDPFFSFFCKYDKEHPNDVYRWLAGELREAILAPGKVVIVVTLQNNDPMNTTTDKIVGWAYWERRGSDSEAAKWQKDGAEQYVLRKIDDFKTPVENLTKGPNYSFKQDKYDHYHSLAEKTFFSMPDRWHLMLTAVDPAYQRQGMATALLEWGFTNATKESVPIALEATEKGRKLYERHGFTTKENLELRPGLTVPAMYWIPAGSNFPVEVVQTDEHV